MKHIVRFGLLLCAIAALLALSAHIVSADTIVSVCDESHLRTAVSGGGGITFSCSGTITLSAPLIIDSYTLIDGSGQRVTLSGNDKVRHFIVSASSTLLLHNLTLTKGHAP